ncbi:hypothetical protein [Flavobacterium hydrophilum]|uniref:Uncharacterized protein n=1 Tax=Flavobacterium hydrophilum TaxID=2211445 RepID=A0A2V4C0C2_9FLAO|nr:hypothetical protein [Flavobacterium hydrophilum]PXY44728.1 hypothetical protein DMB68_14840 [Flavobacterium hydrophilum]
MRYQKSNPEITFEEFLNLCKTLKSFKSLRLREYEVKDWSQTKLIFERKSTEKLWEMEMKDVYKAYVELQSFKTSDFKPYLNRTYSPALGLLLNLGLLLKE